MSAPSSSIYRTLDELIDPRTPLPVGNEVCNLYVTLEERPLYHDSRGGRWLVRVSSLKRSGEAWLAVHREPERADVPLPYKKTDPELIEVFEKPEFARLLVPGETALVQAVPRRSSPHGLILSIPSVLLLRPFATFGRRQIDFSSGCPRRSYLAVAKGVRGIRDSRSPLWSTVGGLIAEDVFLYVARDPSRLQSDPMDAVVPALSPRTIGALMLLGLANVSELNYAVGRGRDAFQTIAASSQLQQLLHADWEPQSDLLNNGVTLAPDLLRDRELLELKHRSPGEHFDQAAFDAQMESYLAWAMVEFGVDLVCTGWNGYVANLHSGGDPAQQVRRMVPHRSMLGRRIRNRHRLLAVVGGAWLPPPPMKPFSPLPTIADCGPGNCPACDFARSLDDGGLPPACPFYCQMERGWDCRSADHECALFGVCDQHDKFVAYERVDLFNRLRQTLLDEEEERATFAAVMPSLSAGAGFVAEGFRVTEASTSTLRLQTPSILESLMFASPGDVLTAIRDGQPVAELRLLRRKNAELRLEARSGRLPAFKPSDVLSLRFAPEGRHPIRQQLQELDRLQRSGQEPVSLRAGHVRSRPLKILESTSFSAEPSQARIVLIDAPGKETLRQAARKFLEVNQGRKTLVIIAGDIEVRDLSISGATLSDDEFADEFAQRTGTVLSRLREMLDHIRSQQIWQLDQEDFWSGRVDAFTAADRKFDDVVILNAECLPILCLNRCLALSRGRVVLIGQSVAAGPRVSTERARGSVLFQNSLRFLMEAGPLVLPDDVGELEIVRLPVRQAACGAASLLGLGNRVRREIPVQWHECLADSPSSDNGDFCFSAVLDRSPDQQQNRIVRLRLLDETKLSLRQLRLLLKGLPARAVEALSATDTGRVNTTLLGCRARVEKVEIGFAREHQVAVSIRANQLPWVQEHALCNLSEAETLVDFAGRWTGACHAVSPFSAQCRIIAELARQKGAANLTVYTLDQLGNRPFSGDPPLLVSAVVYGANPTFPYPLNDPGRLAPLLLHSYSTIHLFASREFIDHHPLFREMITPHSCAAR